MLAFKSSLCTYKILNQQYKSFVQDPWLRKNNSYPYAVTVSKGNNFMFYITFINYFYCFYIIGKTYISIYDVDTQNIFFWGCWITFGQKQLVLDKIIGILILTGKLWIKFRNLICQHTKQKIR